MFLLNLLELMLELQQQQKHWLPVISTTIDHQLEEMITEEKTLVNQVHCQARVEATQTYTCIYQ